MAVADKKRKRAEEEEKRDKEPKKKKEATILKTKATWPKNIKTFAELQDAMIKFLNGIYSEQPWYSDSVSRETVPMLANLKRINELGFVTMNGQPGTSDERCSQRALMEGLLRKDLLPKLIRLTKEAEVRIYVL